MAIYLDLRIMSECPFEIGRNIIFFINRDLILIAGNKVILVLVII